MKRIFLDTNFIIDMVARPAFSADARKVLLEGRKRKMKFYVSFLSLSNYAYIDRKEDSKRVKENLSLFCKAFEILANDKKHIESALLLDAKDFEDAIQFTTALSGKCDCIITRNKKDFMNFATIPVFEPKEFLLNL